MRPNSESYQITVVHACMPYIIMIAVELGTQQKLYRGMHQFVDDFAWTVFT